MQLYFLEPCSMFQTHWLVDTKLYPQKHRAPKLSNIHGQGVHDGPLYLDLLTQVLLLQPPLLPSQTNLTTLFYSGHPYYPCSLYLPFDYVCSACFVISYFQNLALQLFVCFVLHHCYNVEHFDFLIVFVVQTH